MRSLATLAALGGLTLATALQAPAARADGWSVGIAIGAPAPIYVAPPVYYTPPPSDYSPPPRYYRPEYPPAYLVVPPHYGPVYAYPPGYVVVSPPDYDHHRWHRHHDDDDDD